MNMGEVIKRIRSLTETATWEDGWALTFLEGLEKSLTSGAMYKAGYNLTDSRNKFIDLWYDILMGKFDYEIKDWVGIIITPDRPQE